MIICQALNAGLLLPTARALTFLSSPFAERSRLRIDKWFVGTTVYGIATKNPRWLWKWRDWVIDGFKLFRENATTSLLIFFHYIYSKADSSNRSFRLIRSNRMEWHSYQNILWNGANLEGKCMYFGSYMWDAMGKFSMYWNVIRRNASAMCSVCSAILILI